MSIVENEIRLRCLEMAVTIAGRQMQHDPKVVIDIATELCQYAVIGSSPTDPKTVQSKEGAAPKAVPSSKKG